MEKLKSGLIVLVAIVFLVIGIWLSGWSPLNILYGPQYETTYKSVNDAQILFSQETVPERYPMLINFLKGKSIEKVSWISQSGENQQMVLSLADNGLSFETAFFIGSSPSEASISTRSAKVRMVDTNLDGQMDSITYTYPNGGLHTYKAPFDETSSFLWSTSLAIIFRFSECCN